jgi:hypothetical protein
MTKLPRWQAARWPGVVAAVLTCGLLTMVAGGLPAYAAATSFTVSTETPFSDSGPVPCANGGAGEPVDLSGSLHELFHVTVDDSGAVHVTSHDNPQGINGVGETTGAKYQATGVTEDHENQGSGGLPFTFTYVNNFRVIGQGPGNNFLFHENMHVTINADGTVTASTDNARFTCM